MSTQFYILGFILGIFSVNEVCGACRNGWTQYNSSCYLFVHIPMTWWDAIGMCKNLNAQLVEIESKAENDFIETTVREKHDGHAHGYWIGASNIELDHEFVWIGSHTPVTYSGWHPGQPDYNGGRDDCAVLLIDTGYDWHDVPCGEPNFFTCETENPSIGEKLIG